MKPTLFLLASLLLPGPALAGAPLAPKADRNVMVLAHRGCWEGGAPEVSVAAIRACEAIGPEMVEVDVRRTRDGALVLMHDETVDRMTNGNGRVADMTAAEIAALRLRSGGGGPDAPLTRERVATLEDALNAARGRFILHLHLYAGPEADAEIAAAVRKLGMAGQVTAWVSGKPDGERLASLALPGDIGVIPIIRQCGSVETPGCWVPPVQMLTGYAPYQPPGFYIIPEGSLSDEAALRFLKDTAAVPRPAGSRIQVSTLFTLDKLPLPELQAQWQRLIALGAGIIMTDRPAALINLLRSGANADAK